MALTVTPNLTTLNDANTLTGDIGNKAELDPDLKKEGSNSFAFISTAQNGYAGMLFSTAGQDLTNQHIRMWYTSSLGPVVATKALGGIAFFVRDGSGNESYWYVDGSDTYQGGWKNYCIYLNYTDNPPDANNGTNAVLTDLDGAGILINDTGTIRNAINTWIDYLRYGDGLTVYGTPSFGIADIQAIDNANGYGIVQENEGVYYLSGSLLIGDSASTNQTIYEDNGEVIIFTDKLVASTLYKIQALGNATGNTDIDFINTVISSSAPLYDLDLDDAAVETVVIDGCQISNADQILLDTNCTIINTTFNACGVITPEAATIEDITISNSTATNAYVYPALVADDNSARINFTGNTNAVEISTDVDHTFDGHKFPTSSNTFDINNTSGQPIIVYATNGSTASTSTGSSVDIQNSVTVTLTGVVVGSEISIVRTGTQTVEAYIANSVASGEFGYTFNSPPSGFTGVDIFVVKPGYKWEPIYNYTLPATSTTLPINQEFDRNYVA